MVSIEQFSITYDGPGHEDHTIDVRELAPSLIALSDLFDQANQILGGEAGRTNLRFQATKESSFEVQLALVQTVTEQLQAWVLPALGAAYGSGVTVTQLFESVTAAMDFLRKLSAREPARTEPVGDDIAVYVDSDKLVITKHAARLAENFDFRKNVRKTLGPLSLESTTEIRFGAREHVQLPLNTTFLRSDLPKFDEPIAGEPRLFSGESEQLLRLVSPNFKDGNKWKFWDGERDIWATMEDVNFLTQVAMGKPFSNNDALRCVVKRVQWVDAKSAIHNEYSILKVIEHTKSERQLRLL